MSSIKEKQSLSGSLPLSDKKLMHVQVTDTCDHFVSLVFGYAQAASSIAMEQSDVSQGTLPVKPKYSSNARSGHSRSPQSSSCSPTFVEE